MATNNKYIAVPSTYATSPNAHIRISNHPGTAKGVTPIQIATLNRPDKLNAITIDMINDLTRFVSTINVDDRVKVVIVTGAGKAFSAGIDLSNDTSQFNKAPATEARDPGGWLALAMYNCRKTIIVAYNGLSVGIGMTSTLAAAIRIAPAKAEFGFPFSRIGLTMESCSSFFLPRMVGHSKATYLLATGKRFPAESQLLDGIFAELVPEPQDIMPKAISIAEDLLENVSTTATHLNRQLIWRGEDSAEKAHLVDSPLLVDQFASNDHLEFKKAFFEKRKPIFKDTINENAPRTYPWWTEWSILGPAKAQKSSNPRL